MHAKLVFRPAISRHLATATVLLFTFIIAGCKTEKDPDQPTILGATPGTAYLGVEYYYNFGAYGGESILDYSLTNAPPWLALEDTSNKARQGIIMRGVPGLTGGARGDADLGEYTDINIVTTDGDMAGFQSFDIKVKRNPLSLEADTFTEGASSTIPNSRRTQCELPDLETQGRHSFSINEYDDEGKNSGTKVVSFPTRPVFVKVVLDQPSVTRVAVAFELTSDYDPRNCDPGESEGSQKCDHSEGNAGLAIPGKDIVALASGDEEQGVSTLQAPSYLTYRDDGLGGVITLEPGITECYIRLEVVDDSFPEPAEAAFLNLTEVRSGLASLGENDTGASTRLVINDNEPRVRFETINGGTRAAQTIGDAPLYAARLTGKRDGEIRAKLGEVEGSTASIGQEFRIGLPDDSGQTNNSNELIFPEGVDEVKFEVRIDKASYSNTGLNDRVILLGLNESYQLGRENYARAGDGDPLRISINEMTHPLDVAGQEDFKVTDLAVGHDGRLFVAGYLPSENNSVQLRIFNQKGESVQTLKVSSGGETLSEPDPVVGFTKREIAEGRVTHHRFELVVAYNTDEPVTGSTEAGAQNIAAALYHYGDAERYVETWSSPLRTGTAGKDVVRWAGIAASGYVVLAGETNGTWPGQRSAGGVDSFLQRIDSLPEKDTDGEGVEPEIKWTRQTGSSSDDHVAGASTTGTSPLLFGSAAGQVNGEPSLGGEDAYFYTTASGSGPLTVYQRGTEGDEQITDGLVKGSTLWLLGNSTHTYTVTAGPDDNLALTSSGSDSQGGFVLGYTAGGKVIRALNLDDAADSSRETFAALTSFAGDLIAAGSTDGAFTANGVADGSISGIVTRISLTPDVEPDAQEPVFRNQWRYQLDGETDIIRLGNYRDDKVVALAREGESWKILLFSPEGRLLNSPN